MKCNDKTYTIPFFARGGSASENNFFGLTLSILLLCTIFPIIIALVHTTPATIDIAKALGGIFGLLFLVTLCLYLRIKLSFLEITDKGIVYKEGFFNPSSETLLGFFETNRALWKNITTISTNKNDRNIKISASGGQTFIIEISLFSTIESKMLYHTIKNIHKNTRKIH